MKKNIGLLFLVGLAGMIIQISILDILLSYFTRSSIVTGIVIGGWIFGLSIGGLYSTKIIRQEKNRKYIILFQFILGALAMLLVKFTSSSYYYLSILDNYAFPLTLGFVVFIGGLSGTTFLLINGLYKEDKDVNTAKLYSSENFGAAISSLLAGIILIPFLGISISLLIAGSLCLLISFIFSLKQKVISFSILIVFVILMIFLLPLNSGLQEGELYKQQSPYGEVRVVEDPNGILLQINGVNQCHNNEGFIAQDRDAISQIVNKGDVVLNIGLGCGIMHDRIKEMEGQVTTIEINKKIKDVYPFFSKFKKLDENEVIIDDGFKFMLNTNNKYNVIVLDPEEEYVPHSTNLYTLENFENAEQILNEDGLFMIRDISYSPNYGCVLYNTLEEVFDYVYAIQEDYYRYFVGSNSIKYLEEFDQTYCTTSDINTIDKPVLRRYYLT